MTNPETLFLIPFIVTGIVLLLQTILAFAGRENYFKWNRPILFAQCVLSLITFLYVYSKLGTLDSQNAGTWRLGSLVAIFFGLELGVSCLVNLISGAVIGFFLRKT